MPARRLPRPCMGDIPFVFAVAPQHPLAHQPGPLSLEQVRGYRAVVAADSRRLPPRSSPLLAGQETYRAGYGRQADGAGRRFGRGFLPRWLAEQAARDGRVRICAVEAPNPPAPAHYAWREHRARQGAELVSHAVG